MKHIKRLRVFENTQELTQEQINFLDEYTIGEWGVNPNTGLVDVKGDFSCAFQGISSFKGVNFGLVTDNFKCQNNSLTSLKGAPEKVGRSFNCKRNSLTSLEGAPKEVGGYFFCQQNSLTSLKGAPKEVGRWFDCSHNSLTSLEGAPEKVDGGFYCDAFKLDDGEWNPSGWLKILREGTVEAKSLILTLPYFDPESLQREIEKNPGKWVMELKGVWNLEEFRSLRDQLKLSDQFLKDIGDQSTLSDLGF